MCWKLNHFKSILKNMAIVGHKSVKVWGILCSAVSKCVFKCEVEPFKPWFCKDLPGAHNIWSSGGWHNRFMSIFWQICGLVYIGETKKGEVLVIHSGGPTSTGLESAGKEKERKTSGHLAIKSWEESSGGGKALEGVEVCEGEPSAVDVLCRIPTTSPKSDYRTYLNL